MTDDLLRKSGLFWLGCRRSHWHVHPADAGRQVSVAISSTRPVPWNDDTVSIPSCGLIALYTGQG